jgi:hypothetical protein
VLQRQPVFQTPIWGKVGHISGVVGEHASPVHRLSFASIFAVPKVGSNPRALANAIGSMAARRSAAVTGGSTTQPSAKAHDAQLTAERRMSSYGNNRISR